MGTITVIGASYVDLSDMKTFDQVGCMPQWILGQIVFFGVLKLINLFLLKK